MALWDRFIPSADKDEKRAKELWDSAIKYFDGKLYNRALKDLQEAIGLNRAFLQEAIELMQVFSNQGSDEQAMSVGFALLKMQPDNAELMNKLGNSLRKLHSYSKAKKLYTMALKIKPKYVEARYNLAASSFRITTSDNELVSQTRAVEAYTKPRRYDFQGDRVGFYPLDNQTLDQEEPGKGKEEEDAGEDSMAADRAEYMESLIADLKRDLEVEPNSWAAQYNLGLMYDLAGKGDDAIEHLRASTALEPQNRMSNNNLGVALMVHKQDFESAEGVLLKNLEQYPFDRTTVLNLGVLYSQQNKGFQKLKYYVYLGDLLAKSLGEFETETAEAYAKDLYERRKYLEAIPMFENMALEKQEAFWYEKLAVMYFNQKKEDKVVSTYKRLLKLVPDHEEAKKKLIDLANDYEKQAREKIEKGSRSHAISLMLKAAKIVETPERWVELAQLYEDEGEEILAQNALRRWKQLSAPDAAEAGAKTAEHPRA
ncbi:MAG: tetratricopeptide repeat protein [Candidatus Lambdaproteobacteria bacterium]|nr:tetratricopeptide repeat protein [Candidatus Lambdaproteobacteria bacterium]